MAIQPRRTGHLANVRIMTTSSMQTWWDQRAKTEQAEWLEAARSGLTKALAATTPADHRDGQEDPWVYMTGADADGATSATWHLDASFKDFLEHKLQATTTGN
jgi:hypothetical protein